MLEMKKPLALLLLLFLIYQGVYAADSISRIDIKGNKVVSSAAIISKIKVRAGQPYNDNVINEDIKNLNSSGFFENIEAIKKDTSGGIIVVFKVKEKPVLKKITFEGNKHLRKKTIEDAIDMKPGSFIDEYRLKEAKSKARDLYNKKGFSQAKIVYDLKVSDNNEAEVKFIIEENKVIKVRKISIVGNKNIHYKAIVKVIKTRWAWLFNAGIFKEDVLKDDIKRIGDFYRLKGFGDVKVETATTQDKKGVYVTFTIEEGMRYYVGEIKVEGYQNLALSEIKSVMELKPGSIYSDYASYTDINKIRELYMDKGYIFSKIIPDTYFDLNTKRMNLTFKISENDLAYIEKITIKGNTRTKDKVIRRELRIYPGNRYDGKKIKKSKERLDNLGYFEEVRFDTQPGTANDQVNLVTDVKETKTGSLSFGGGYSSIDKLMGFVEVRQNNFDYKNFSTFSGAGQSISLGANLGSVSSNYNFNFVNPYIYDSPYTLGMGVYRSTHKMSEDTGYAYAEEDLGASIGISREFKDTWRAGVNYKPENVKISDVADEASQAFKDEMGSATAQSLEFILAYDCRDNVIVPTSGMLFSNSFQLTGGILGGDRNFIKYYSGFNKYFPMINKSVLEYRLGAGFSQPFSSTEKVPIFYRFFAGGASSVRGYEERILCPHDLSTDEPLGGDSIFLATAEYTYPLVDFVKVAVFFDAGNVWELKKDFFSSGLKKSYGLGLRIKTPIGPISLDYGIPLDKVNGEKKSGRLNFNVSRGF